MKKVFSKRKGKTSIFQTLFFIGLIGGLFFVGGILLWFVTLEIPSVDGFHNRKVEQSTKIFDRTGDVLLYDVHGTIRRTVIPLENISPNIRNASIAIEDSEFYSHNGIRPLRTIKAVLDNIVTGNLLGGQGGSTITQQVVKNTILTPEKTITRKIKEWILALKLEKQLTKDEILEIYLNETPYGGTIYGVEEASLHFFSKQAKDVTLSEAAYLAALPQAPTYFSPYGNHKDDLEKRKNLVLNRMEDDGFITKEEYELALNEKVLFLGQDDTGIKAPHFVFFIREYLEEKYGVNAVNEQGLKVITTLDFDLQQKAQEIVTRAALENEEKFNAENAGMVAIDPKTGQILVMVGSRGYFDEGIEGKFNLAVAKRQPGSAFKPFVYATAFEKGYTPQTVVFDLKTQFSTTCEVNVFDSEGTCYSPDNYDNTFRGPMTLRDALAQSVNIPSVKVLYLAGINSALDMASRLGITTLVGQNRYGLTLVLGGGEVTLLEMVSSYGVFANEGVRHPYTGILSVEDSKGNLLEEYQEKSERVINIEVARQISDVLSDNRARTPAFGEFSGLYFPGFDVAAKTGTTNDYRDAWIIGYTPTIAVGSWAGNNDNTPMEKKVAGFIVAPMWNEFMKVAINKLPVENFTPPAQIQEELPPILKGVWNTLDTTTTGVHSILYWIDKDNPMVPRQTDPVLDSQFLLWEYPISLWVARSGGIFPTNIFFTNPITGEVTQQNTPSPLSSNTFSIIYPKNGSVVGKDELLTITIGSSDIYNIKSVSYYINGIHVGTSSQNPFSLSFIPTVSGDITLQAISSNASGIKSSEITFKVK
jgi:1A family penicillin-binding protein